jgi:hypothetical protein
VPQVLLAMHVADSIHTAQLDVQVLIGIVKKTENNCFFLLLVIYQQIEKK